MLKLAMNLFPVIRKINHLVAKKLEPTFPCFHQRAQVDMFEEMIYRAGLACKISESHSFFCLQVGYATLKKLLVHISSLISHPLRALNRLLVQLLSTMWFKSWGLSEYFPSYLTSNLGIKSYLQIPFAMIAKSNSCL